MSDFLSSFGEMVSQLSATLLTSTTGSSGGTQDNFISIQSFYGAYKECRSNHEVSVFVGNHTKYLKWLLNNTRLTDEQTYEILQRCLVCKALGHDTPFAIIHAIQLAQSAQTWRHKRMAYVACCQLIDITSDMVILMVSTLQRDLRSKHVPTICLALSMAANILTAELIPSVEALVCERTKHPSPIVRQKAAICLATFLRKHKDGFEDKLSYLKVVLRDKDPQTMTAGLQAINSLSLEQIQSSDELHKPLLFILQQFLNGTVPKKFLKGGVCGPHVVVLLINLLGKLDHAKSNWKSKIVIALLSVMDKYDSTATAPAVMIMDRCCHILANITTDSKHLARISSYAGHLLKLESLNYHYVGLSLLYKMIQCERSSIAQYQDAVVGALGSADSVIAEKSMMLILQLTNATNVQHVYELFSKLCKSSGDRYIRHGVTILTMCELTETNSQWFAGKLLELMCLSVRHPTHNALDAVLGYMGGEGVRNAISILFNELKNFLGREDSPVLDVFTLVLWLKMKHSSSVNIGNEEILSLLRSSLDTHQGPFRNIMALLTAVRRLVVDVKLTLKSDDVALLRQLAAASNSEAECYVYLKEISNTKEVAVSDTKVTDSLLADMERYKLKRVEAGTCRQVGVGEVKPQAKGIKFTSDLDTSLQSMSLSIGSQLGQAKEVWTARGRVENSPDHVPDTPDSTDEAAPVEFHAEEDDEHSTAHLAQQVFQSL